MKTIVKQIKKLSDSLNEVLPPAEMVALLRFVTIAFKMNLSNLSQPRPHNIHTCNGCAAKPEDDLAE